MHTNGLGRKTHAPTTALAGFILADAKWKLIYANPEAKRILAYPKNASAFEPGWIALRKSILPLLAKHDSSTTQLDLKSGRRRYVSRVIPLIQPSDGRKLAAATAVLLERGGEASRVVAEMCEHFDLTTREMECVELLVKGLTNKEIAEQMDISPNTVRTFLRIVMLKLGVSTRSGIVGVIFSAIDKPCESNK